MMNAAENECVAQDDVRLFHKGACHIFAAALQAEFPSEHYAIKRVSLRKEFETQGAYHVYATKSEFMVDACGIKREEDYLAWLIARHREESFGRVVFPALTVHDTSEAELLARDHDDPDLGSVNRWGLSSGQDFAAAARVRAVSLIKHWPKKYQVSVLEAGRDCGTQSDASSSHPEHR